MFGWRKVGGLGAIENSRFRFGLVFETYDTGQWFDVYCGHRRWSFTRYTKNRHTGPEDNGPVMKAFLGQPDNRPKGGAFAAAFAARAQVPPPTLAELRPRGDGSCPGCDDPEC